SLSLSLSLSFFRLLLLRFSFSPFDSFLRLVLDTNNNTYYPQNLAVFVILGEPSEDFSACHLRSLNLKLFYVPILFSEKEFDSWLTKQHFWETFQYTLWKPQVQAFQFAI